MNFLLAFVGAGLGGSMRHCVNVVAQRYLGGAFPYNTLIVNIAGCLLMGLAAEYWALRHELPQAIRLFLTTGFMGGFTTFSAFSLDTVALWERGDPLAAAMYVGLSVSVSIGALLIGLWTVRTILGGA